MNDKKIVFGKDTARPLTARRPGYETMRFTGPEILGEPKDSNEAIRLLKKAAELSVNFFDTADFYGSGEHFRLETGHHACYIYEQKILSEAKKLLADHSLTIKSILENRLRQF